MTEGERELVRVVEQFTSAVLNHGASAQVVKAAEEATLVVAWLRGAEQDDPMPAGWNRPAPADANQLVEVLEDVLTLVREGDSWEGFVQWSMPTDEPELEGADFGLIARYRIGNLAGQGGLRVYSPDDDAPG